MVEIFAAVTIYDDQGTAGHHGGYGVFVLNMTMNGSDLYHRDGGIIPLLSLRPASHRFTYNKNPACRKAKAGFVYR